MASLPSPLRRRDLLFAAMSVVAGCAASALRAAPADTLYVLGPDDPGRFKLEFDANRSKVRLVFMLSPT